MRTLYLFHPHRLLLPPPDRQGGGPPRKPPPHRQGVLPLPRQGGDHPPVRSRAVRLDEAEPRDRPVDP